MEHEAWLLRRTDDRDDPERHGEYEAGMAGMKAPELSRRQGIRDATFYRYKVKFDGMNISDAKKLRALQDENIKLKRVSADAMLDDSASKDLATKTLMPDLKRRAVRDEMDRHGLSERRAQELADLNRSVLEYRERDAGENAIRKRR